MNRKQTNDSLLFHLNKKWDGANIDGYSKKIVSRNCIQHK